MARFLLPPDIWHSDPALTGDEARHLSQVLRIRAGEGITVFDGCGRHAEAEVTAVSRDRVSLRISDEVQSLPPTLPAITLAQAIPKGKNMDLIVQKAVELGIAAIQPIITRHTIVHPDNGKSAKWRRVALEACKQCGQDRLPVIADPMGFNAWLDTARCQQGLKIIASLAPGAGPLREVLREHPATTAATLLVGPEGDFSPQETRSALAAGYVPVSLGSIVLRVETATLYCLSALRYEFGGAARE